jgi:hypothetical protein
MQTGCDVFSKATNQKNESHVLIALSKLLCIIKFCAINKATISHA